MEYYVNGVQGGPISVGDLTTLGKQGWALISIQRNEDVWYYYFQKKLPLWRRILTKVGV